MNIQDFWNDKEQYYMIDGYEYLPEDVQEVSFRIQIKVRDNYFIKRVRFIYGVYFQLDEKDWYRSWYNSDPAIMEVTVLDNGVRRKVSADTEEGKALVKVILDNKRFCRKFEHHWLDWYEELSTDYWSGLGDD